MQWKKMRVTVLGCGTSTGVPYLHCKCKVCRSRNPKNKRTRASVKVEIDGKHFLIDVSPDFRAQMLRDKMPRIDAILLTHPHADHIGGLDEIRSYNFLQKERIQAFGHAWTLNDLKSRFPYLFSRQENYLGGGIAEIDLHEFNLEATSFFAAGVKIIPIPLLHGRDQVAGFRIGDFAYLTDCSEIPKPSLDRLKGLSVLILDCLRLEPHGTHLNFDQALQYSTKIAAKKTIFTHLSHDFGYEKFSKTLPKRHSLAYDGLTVHLTNNIK